MNYDAILEDLNISWLLSDRDLSIYFWSNKKTSLNIRFIRLKDLKEIDLRDS